MSKNRINSFSYQLTVLNEKIRIAKNLKRCLQQIDSSASSSSASSSSDGGNLSEIDGYIANMSKLRESLVNKKAALSVIERYNKLDKSSIDEEEYDKFITEYNKLYSVEGRVSFETYKSLTPVAKGSFWTKIIDSLTSLTKDLNSEEIPVELCPLYKSTVNASKDYISSAVKAITEILPELDNLSEECKTNINAILKSYERKTDYITMQQATALLVFLRELQGDSDKLDDDDRKAFKSMFVQYSFDEKNKIAGKLKELLKLEPNLSSPYNTALLRSTLIVLGCLLAVAVCAVLIAGTIYIGVTGFQMEAHPQAGDDGRIAFFIPGLIVSVLAAWLGVAAAIGTICAPIHEFRNAGKQAQENQSYVSAFKIKAQETLVQLAQFGEGCPDFHADRISDLQRYQNLDKDDRIDRSPNFFQPAVDSIRETSANLKIAETVYNQLDEHRKTMEKENADNAVIASMASSSMASQ